MSKKKTPEKRKAQTRATIGLPPVIPDTRTEDQKALSVCEFVIEGDSVRHASWRAGIDVTKFMRMVAKSEDEHTPLVQQYLRAREARADMRFEDIDDTIKDLKNKLIDPHTAKVIIDAKFRQMGKENAKRYGDRLELAGEVKTDNHVHITREVITKAPS